MSGSAENSARRARGRPWPKGTSGNPGGRPKDWPYFRRIMREVGAPVAFEVLLAAMQGRHPLARIRAAQVVLAYAWGHPAPVQAGYEMPAVPPAVARKLASGEAPRGPFELRVIVEDSDGTERVLGERSDLPGGGTEGDRDSDSLPSSGVPPAEA